VASVTAVPGSFRDPGGRVWRVGDRILRTVMPSAAPHYEFARDSGLLARLEERGALIGHAEVDAAVLGDAAAGARYVLEHPRLPFVSHPYEWPFAALQAAALLQLDLLLEAIAAGATLSDATAYNVQFRGAEPVFIDTLSFRRYEEGSYWLGHRQFCEQFLNPLLLRSHLNLPYHAWYRGSPEGIAAADVARLLPAWRKLAPNVAMHVVLQARLQAGQHAREKAEAAVARGGGLSRKGFTDIVRGLRVWIQGLEPAQSNKTAFADYATDNTYSAADTDFKARFVAEYAASARPAVVLDLGCNTGRFSDAALEGGAGYAVGVDGDTDALDRAYAISRKRKRPLLALHMNLSDPTPSQGWAQGERAGLAERCAQSCDGVLALAVVHHLAIAGNVPLAQVVRWIASLAPTGVVEFVPKSDPMVQRLLALREDVFADYDEDTFARALEAEAEIVARETVPGTGRRLYRYARRAPGRA
jgi:ribosomal protein L11 methylase PrmA